MAFLAIPYSENGFEDAISAAVDFLAYLIIMLTGARTEREAGK
jgi:hypothetical protein